MGLVLLILAACPVFAAEWGPPVNGLRVSLALRGDAAAIAFENIRERDMYLPVGRLFGAGTADFVHLYLLAPDGARRRLTYTGGSGVVPGRLVAYVVPMMGGSTYSLRTPLRYWRLGSELRRIEEDLSRGARLQAEIDASEASEMHYVAFYGLRIFWSGRALSNIVSRPKP